MARNRRVRKRIDKTKWKKVTATPGDRIQVIGRAEMSALEPSSVFCEPFSTGRGQTKQWHYPRGFVPQQYLAGQGFKNRQDVPYVIAVQSGSVRIVGENIAKAPEMSPDVEDHILHLGQRFADANWEGGQEFDEFEYEDFKDDVDEEDEIERPAVALT